MRPPEDDHRNSFCRAFDLHYREIQVIVYLGQNGSSKMKNIGSNLSLSLSNLTVIIDKLEEKGLAERVRSIDDRRIVKANLSKKGQEIFDSHHVMKLEMSKNMLEKLTVAERTSYLALMRKITANGGSDENTWN